MEIQAIEKCINNGRREKVKKMGFFGDSGALGVEWMACWWQTHLQEEARVQTVSHALVREF